jgi:uncharacterized protein YjlB
MEVRALEVGHGLKVLLPYGIPLMMNQEEHDWHLRGSGKAGLTWEVSATCAACSTVSSSSVPMTVPIHGSIGLRGIITRTSHLSMPWAIEMG